MTDEEPLTRLKAQQRWPRSAIKEFPFPPPPRSQSRVIPRRQPGSPTSGPQGEHASAPGLPASRDITVEPDLLRPTRRLRAVGRSVEPLIVYPPDRRQVFKDTTYPWRACGRVTTNSAQGSGALVGPRHLLTASHVIGWTATDAGSVLFQPDFFDHDVFPHSWSEIVYSYEKVSGGDQGEYSVAEDYVVCILRDRLGDELGWLGSRKYEDRWDQTSYWNHVGYPGDVGFGARPAWELWFSIANSWSPGFFEEGAGLDIETFASMNHGDSGGPVFGWWADGPYIVAVVSAMGTMDPNTSDPIQSRTGNWLAGGHELPDLVSQALVDYP